MTYISYSHALNVIGRQVIPPSQGKHALRFGNSSPEIPRLVLDQSISRRTYIPVGRDSQPLKSISPQGRTGRRLPIDGVGYPRYVNKALDRPIATESIFSCSVLIVINPEQKWHYMGHVDVTVPVGALKKHFEAQGLNVPGSRFYLLPGNADPASTTETILRALHEINPQLPNQVQFVYFPNEDMEREGIIASHNGQIGYLPPNYPSYYPPYNRPQAAGDLITGAG